MGAGTRLGRTKSLLVREITQRRGTLECPGCLRGIGPESLTKHHIRPRSRGGVTTIENLVLICRPCHDAMHRKKPSRADRIAKARLRRFLLERSLVPFPPPPEPVSAEDTIRLFFHGVSVRLQRAARHTRFIANPPFDPCWPVARALPVRVTVSGPWNTASA